MTRLSKQIQDEFISVRLRPGNMLIYTVRNAILESVKKAVGNFYGSVLDVGCGFMPYRQMVESNPNIEKYTGMDLEQPTYYGDVEPDLKWNGTQIPLDDASVDCVMATEFLEHYPDPERILKEILRVIKPDGRFFATVPFIWNLHEVPYDEYRYTPYSLERHLKNAGFKGIKIEPLGGWNLSLAQMIGLWVAFSKMHRIIRAVLRIILFPVYVLLIKTDRKPAEFDGYENSMFIGLSITARGSKSL
jgi:SAM-dependent methyltransferase